MSGVPGDRKHLIEQPAMLRGDAGANDDARRLGQRTDDGEKLDRLGPRSEDHQGDATTVCSVHRALLSFRR